MNPVIWHNPRCSKSRQALALLEQQGIEPTVVRYLEDPPSAAKLTRVLKLLGLRPRDLMRRKEKLYKELKLGDEGLTDAQLIEAMVANPLLIERPVVITDRGAALGRPPENVLSVV